MTNFFSQTYLSINYLSRFSISQLTLLAIHFTRSQTAIQTRRLNEVSCEKDYLHFASYFIGDFNPIGYERFHYIVQLLYQKRSCSVMIHETHSLPATFSTTQDHNFHHKHHIHHKNPYLTSSSLTTNQQGSIARDSHGNLRNTNSTLLH